MKKKQYAISADMYDQLASDTELPKADRQNAAFRGAESYRFNHMPKQALKLYNKALQYGAQDPIAIYRIAQMYKQLGDYEKAIEAFKKYQKEVPSDERIEPMIKGCEKALVWKEEKSRYKVDAFKPANDKKADDFSPMWADRKNKTIMFTSDRDDGYSDGEYDRTLRNHSDVWEVKLTSSRGK